MNNRINESQDSLKVHRINLARNRILRIQLDRKGSNQLLRAIDLLNLMTCDDAQKVLSVWTRWKMFDQMIKWIADIIQNMYTILNNLNEYPLTVTLVCAAHMTHMIWAIRTMTLTQDFRAHESWRLSIGEW